MTTALEIGTRRRCDNCAGLYTVKKIDHRFCRDHCRSEFNRFGTPLIRLRPVITREIARAIEEFEFRIYRAMDQQGQRRYRALYPARARRFDVLEQADQAAAG